MRRWPRETPDEIDPRLFPDTPVGERLEELLRGIFERYRKNFLDKR